MPGNKIPDRGPGAPLTGIRVLIAEDEPLLIMLLTDLLSDLGCVVTGSATQVAHAMLLASGDNVDVAILDVNLDGADIGPLVDMLEARAVPVVLATGYDAREIMQRFPRSELLPKPYSIESLRRALEQALAVKPARN